MDEEYSVIIDGRNIYYSGYITNVSLNEIKKLIIEINIYDEEEETKVIDYKRKPIHFYIDSIGGNAFTAFGLVDIMLKSKTPIYTYNNGICSSAGFDIFIAGHKRFARQHSVFLYHQTQISIYNSYPVKYLLENMDFQYAFQLKLEEYTLSRTKFTKEMIDEIREKKIDYYFMPDKAIELGVVDEII